MRILSLTLLVVVALTQSGCTDPKPISVNNNTVSNVTIPTGQIYFFSATCAHCQTVKNYMNDNNVKQTHYFLELEVSQDTTNTNTLRAVGKRCLIKESELSVPLFWDGTKCFVGSDEVISFLENLK